VGQPFRAASRASARLIARYGSLVAVWVRRLERRHAGPKPCPTESSLYCFNTWRFAG